MAPFRAGTCLSACLGSEWGPRSPAHGDTVAQRSGWTDRVTGKGVAGFGPELAWCQGGLWTASQGSSVPHPGALARGTRPLGGSQGGHHDARAPHLPVLLQTRAAAPAPTCAHRPRKQHREGGGHARPRGPGRPPGPWRAPGEAEAQHGTERSPEPPGAGDRDGWSGAEALGRGRPSNPPASKTPTEVPTCARTSSHS